MRLYPYLIFCVIIILLPRNAWSDDVDVSVRLGFLLNFSRFTTWPSQTLREGQVMNICILQEGPSFLEAFDTLGQQVVQGHRLKVMLISSPKYISTCHVLYLPSDFLGPLGSYIASADATGVLMVSDYPNFIDKGGMIELVQLGGRYVFDVNLKAIRHAGLYVGTNLLKLARSVK